LFIGDVIEEIDARELASQVVDGPLDIATATATFAAWDVRDALGVIADEIDVCAEGISDRVRLAVRCRIETANVVDLCPCSWVVLPAHVHHWASV
jgi:hypothetical protein